MNPGILPVLEKRKGAIKLPSLSQNIHTLMKTLADDQISYRQLAAVINNYPEIAARLIVLANSAWSAPVVPITTIELACSRLGMSVIRSVGIALAVSSRFNPALCPDFDAVHFWTSSMLAAEGASLLASELQKHDRRQDLQKTAQTAGLLHNLGLLWLAEHFPAETGKALRLHRNDPELTVSVALFQCAGADYCVVGGWIGRQWKIPDVLTTAMQYHLHADYREQCWEMVLLVGSAAAMASAAQRHSEQAPVSHNLAEEFGLDSSVQQQIFLKLQNKLDGTRELARTLFSK